MDRPPPASLIRIGDCAFDKARGTLMRRGEIVPVRAKTYALLSYLVANRGRVASKDELMAAVWPDVVVTEDSLTQCVRDLRRALGDDGQRWLKTVPRRGYLFGDDAGRMAAPSVRGGAETVVAVLPFATIGDVDAVLIDGIIEEVTTGLALFRTVTVIARASAFAFPAEGRPPPADIGDRLGADHLVEGSFRKVPAGYRISIRLIHAPSARQIWGEQFDCTEADLLAIDTIIAQRIVGRLAVNIEEAVLRRAAGALPSSLEAFEHLVRGRMLLRSYDEQGNLAALEHFNRAIAIDHEFGLAHAYLALAEIIIAGYGAAPREVLERARERVGLALALSPQDGRCHRIMGLAHLFLREHDAAERNLRRALHLNPYDADALAQMGFVLTMRGRPDEGLAMLERAVELNPFHPAWYDSDLQYAYYALGRYREAIAALHDVPDSSPFHELRLAASYAMDGDDVKAAHHMAEALAQLGDTDCAAHMRHATEFEYEREFAHVCEGIARAFEAYRAASQSASSASARSSDE
jgi:DNA-binding winged helix-turn-helix (wHTH) protein/tetratricopeptide (TPR) repeat protein